MAYPNSSDVAGGDKIRASQYNNLRSDALYPILQSFTYGETIAVNDAVYLKAADGKVYKTDADFNDERIYNFIGFAKETGNANDIKKVQIGGKVEGFSGLTKGIDYYLSNTAGGISSTNGTYQAIVGIAISATEILIREGYYVPSNNVKHVSDTMRQVKSTTPTKLKETKVNLDYLGPKIKIYFTLALYNATNRTVYGRIYKNGSAIGTQRSVTGETSQTFEEELGPFVKNDLIQVYGWCQYADPETCRVSNFRLAYDKVLIPRVDFTNQDP